MLPDFPSIKKAFDEKAQLHLAARVRECMGALAAIPTFRVHEGTHLGHRNELGDKPVVEPVGGAATITITDEEIENSSWNTVLRKYDDAAISIAKGATSTILGALDKSTTEHGQVVDAKGGKLRPEHLFDMLKKLWISFDEEGAPQFPGILSGPSGMAAFQAVLTEIDSDPSLARTFVGIMDDKREAWRAREANRTVVG